MTSPLRALATLEAVAHTYGGGAAGTKLTALEVLDRTALPNAATVRRLHEALCFLRAYPDSRALERRVVAMLEGFAGRPDLARFRARLTDSGIAGTAIRFRFFSAMASWLAERWPRRLAIEWSSFETRERLETFLPLLVLGGEQPGLDEIDLGLRGWLRTLAGSEAHEAAFLIRRFHAMPASSEVIEKLWDELDPPLVLRPAIEPSAPRGRHATGRGRAAKSLAATPAGEPPLPSRTLAFAPRAPRALQPGPLVRTRPDLHTELDAQPRALRHCSPAEGAALIDLARAAMVTRSRDLDAFSYGDPRDVRLVDWGGGLAFACVGVQPARRLMFEAVYAFLTLRNGVPIGYVLNSALFGSAEIAYNVFDTYRGAEAAAVYAKVLAMVRHLFGAGTFTIFPYQLGDGNDEAIESGAWWFYRKLGFAPRARAARAILRAEESRMRRRPAHRSSPATLRKLARENLYFSLGPERDDVIGELELAGVGLAVSRFLAANWGEDRMRAEKECETEASRRLGLPPGTRALAGWTHDERKWWSRWAPLVCITPGLESWSADEKRRLVEVIRAKGARRETDFVRAFDAHVRLRETLVSIARRAHAF